MSNLSSLVQGEGIQIAENVEFESMTESQMADILSVAMEEAVVEGLSEVINDEKESGNAVGEGTIMEGVLPEDAAVMEVSVVRLDKKARKQRAYKLAILQCAKDDDNKDYKKLETIWRMEKFLFRKLEKRYMARARSRMNQTANKASGKNGIVTRAKHILKHGGETRSQKETAKALAGQVKPPTQLKTQFNSIATKLSNKMK